jgi:hypothetical protein
MKKLIIETISKIKNFLYNKIDNIMVVFSIIWFSLLSIMLVVLISIFLQINLDSNTEIYYEKIPTPIINITLYEIKDGVKTDSTTFLNISEIKK